MSRGPGRVALIELVYPIVIEKRGRRITFTDFDVLSKRYISADRHEAMTQEVFRMIVRGKMEWLKLVSGVPGV